jgi:hypothetical protein
VGLLSQKSFSIQRAPHASSSSDLSPYDFWLSPFLKKLKAQDLPTAQEMIGEMSIMWDAITSKELQNVFAESLHTPVSVIAHSGAGLMR